MKTWYRIVKWFAYHYEDRFFPELPRELWNIFRKVDIDLGYLRFRKQVLAVHQVDFVLDSVAEDITLEPQQKMFFKNLLLERGLMVYGFTLDKDNEVTRVDRSLVELMETKKRLWNKGRNPQIKSDVRIDMGDFGFKSEPESESEQEEDEMVETPFPGNRSWAYPYEEHPIEAVGKEVKKESDVKPEEYTGPIN